MQLQQNFFVVMRENAGKKAILEGKSSGNAEKCVTEIDAAATMYFAAIKHGWVNLNQWGDSLQYPKSTML